METADVLQLIALLLLVAGAAFLGAAEAALLRVSRVRVEVMADGGSRRASTLLSLLGDLPVVLNTVLLVVLLVQIGAATLSGALAARLFGSLAVTIASIVLTLVLFVYTEAIPKTYAVHHPERVALWTAPVIRGLVIVLRPIVYLLVLFADLQAPGTGVASSAAPTEEELLLLTEEAAATGMIEPGDKALIDRVFELGDRRVDEIMVPRIDVIGVEATASVEEAMRVAIAAGHRRLIVWHGDLDRVVGVIRLKDLAVAALDDRVATVSSYTTPPLTTPQSRLVVDLLDDMQRSGSHLAVVVDEHGGIEGIVTIEDVVTELVGPVADEGEVTIDEISQVSEGVWNVVGGTDLLDLSRELGTDFPEGEWTTAAGLVLAEVGDIPSVGATIPISGWDVEVVAVDSNRIKMMRFTGPRS